MAEEFRIDAKLKKKLRPLTPEQVTGLEAEIREAGGARDSLLVWKEENVLLDGHHRYAICKRLNLPYKVDYLSFPNRKAAILWLIRHHLNRRNFTEAEIRYYRGVEYEEAKLDRKDNLRQKSPKGQNVPSEPATNGETTAQRLADEHKVSDKTIKRDAQFANAVDVLTDKLGDEVREQVLGMEAPVKRGQVPKLAEVAKVSSELAREVLDGDRKLADAQALARLPSSERKKAHKMVEEGEAKTIRDAVARLDGNETKPERNGKPWRLPEALDRVRARVRGIAKQWPQEFRQQLSDELKRLAEEVEYVE